MQRTKLLNYTIMHLIPKANIINGRHENETVAFKLKTDENYASLIEKLHTPRALVKIK